MRRAQRRRGASRRRPLAIGGGIAVLVAAVIGLLVAGGDGGDDGERISIASAGDHGTELVAYQGAEIAGGAGEFQLADVVGQGRPVILNFWAANCPPCRLEMPWFQDAHEQYGDRVILLGVDIGPFVGLGSNQEGAELLEELGITYAAAAAAGDGLVQRYRILSMPTTVFFDGSGQQVDLHAGLLTQDQINNAFQQLAAQ